ncbi:hypothetical protein DXG01_001311, partial [Tephrocybe rancida]
LEMRIDNATFINHGHHFGRTVETFDGVLPLINHGRYLSNILIQPQLTVAHLTEVERAVWRTYRRLLSMIPQLEGFHSASSLVEISKLIYKGILAARLHDKRALRAKMVSLLALTFGDNALSLEGLEKNDWGFNNPLTRSLICPVDVDWDEPTKQEAIEAGAFKRLVWGWPSFVYGFNACPDHRDMWDGLFRSPLLVTAYKRVITSPSSLAAQMQLSRSKTQPGDCCIYGLTHVTPRSLAYIAMQVHSALGSSRLFIHEDAFGISSRRFYELVVHFFDKFSNDDEMQDLLVWWMTAEDFSGEGIK